MATRVGSVRIRLGGHGVVLAFVGSVNISSPRCPAICPFYWDAWDLGGHCRMGLRQMVAQLRARLRAKKRSSSRRSHQLIGTAALCATVCNSVCPYPTSHRTLEYRQSHIPRAHWQRLRNMVSCGTGWCGNRLVAVPLNFARHRFGALADILRCGRDFRGLLPNADIAYRSRQ
jgi:hypothetical protein